MYRRFEDGASGDKSAHSGFHRDSDVHAFHIQTLPKVIMVHDSILQYEFVQKVQTRHMILCGPPHEFLSINTVHRTEYTLDYTVGYRVYAVCTMSYCSYKHTNPRTAMSATHPLHGVHRMDHSPLHSSTPTKKQKGCVEYPHTKQAGLLYVAISGQGQPRPEARAAGPSQHT
jgi:hypothetical protein